MTTTLMSPGEDMFAHPAQAIVNPVNCVGIMGKGLAKVFETRFPQASLAYKNACTRGELKPGGLLAFQQAQNPSHSPMGPQWVVNLATKNHWRDPSQMAWIESGAVALRTWADQVQVASIACPALGAGNGMLAWPDVRAAIEEAFKDSTTLLYLFPPHEELAASNGHRPAWRASR